MALGKSQRFLLNSVIAANLSVSSVIGVGALLALGSLVGLPQNVYASPTRVTLSLSRQAGESYESFLKRAEALAGVGIQRTFSVTGMPVAGEVLATEVIVTVISENLGVSIPLMDVQVTRSQWQANPNPQAWAQYYDGAPRPLELLNR